MLPASKRLSRNEFNILLEKNRTLREGSLMLRYRLLDDSTMPSKFSVVISKKVAKDAVTRHLLKRRAYAVLRDHAADLKPGFFSALFIQQGFQALEYPDIERLVVSLLRQARAL